MSQDELSIESLPPVMSLRLWDLDFQVDARTTQDLEGYGINVFCMWKGLEFWGARADAVV